MTTSANSPRMMTLQEALGVLARVHTRDDELAGYTVAIGAWPAPWDHDDYVVAWGILRDYVQSTEGMTAEEIR